MSSLDSILFQLTSGLISETVIPTHLLIIPVIKETLERYNWSLRVSNIQGWTTVIRQINYSS